jgi:hypothetical protein
MEPQALQVRDCVYVCVRLLAVVLALHGCCSCEDAAKRATSGARSTAGERMLRSCVCRGGCCCLGCAALLPQSLMKGNEWSHKHCRCDCICACCFGELL